MDEWNKLPLESKRKVIDLCQDGVRVDELSHQDVGELLKTIGVKPPNKKLDRMELLNSLIQEAKPFAIEYDVANAREDSVSPPLPESKGAEKNESSKQQGDAPSDDGTSSSDLRT